MITYDVYSLKFNIGKKKKNVAFYVNTSCKHNNC